MSNKKHVAKTCLIRQNQTSDWKFNEEEVILKVISEEENIIKKIIISRCNGIISGKK